MPRTKLRVFACNAVITHNGIFTEDIHRSTNHMYYFCKQVQRIRSNKILSYDLLCTRNATRRSWPRSAMSSLRCWLLVHSNVKFIYLDFDDAFAFELRPCCIVIAVHRKTPCADRRTSMHATLCMRRYIEPPIVSMNIICFS